MKQLRNNITKKKAVVSIIIVNWNGRKWLKKCLMSLENQSYKKLEIIVVDNGSKDDSSLYIETSFPQVKLITNKKNLGLTKAFNIGFKKAQGEYIILFNNDAWVERDFVEKLYRFYIKSDFDVIAPIEKRYDKSTEFKCNTTIDPIGSPAYFVPTYSREKKIFYLSVCFFFSKKVYEDSRGMDEDYFLYYEDVDWFWRLSLLGKKFAYITNITVYHSGAGSIDKKLKYNSFVWKNQNNLQTLIKNYSLPMLFLILPIYILQNVVEMLFFTLTLQPGIAYSYIQGWIFNIKHIRRTLKKRYWIQKHRVVPDLEIIKKMYIGPAKLKMLINYLK